MDSNKDESCVSKVKKIHTSAWIVKRQFMRKHGQENPYVSMDSK